MVRPLRQTNQGEHLRQMRPVALPSHCILAGTPESSARVLRDTILDACPNLRRGPLRRDEANAECCAALEPIVRPLRSIRSVLRDMHWRGGADCAQTPHVASSRRGHARTAVCAACHSISLRGRVYSMGESVEPSPALAPRLNALPLWRESEAEAIHAIDSRTLAASE